MCLAENKEECNKIDGPCKGILEYMKRYDYIAPSDWEGYRHNDDGH